MKPRTTALDATVFGVDVHSGDIRGSAPSFALAVLEDSSIDRSVVTFRKLQRRIADEKPAVLATDNVFELAADKRELIGFLRALPAGTRLVQVTGAERPESLARVAKRHGVPYEKAPMAEAEAAARLAAASVGYEVTAFTDTTRIKVSRGRSTGKGGWSEDRHTRRMHGAVKRRSRAVAAALDEAGLEYDQEITEKYGGYANAVFTVSAPPEALPVTAERSGDVRIEIERERRDGIDFEPLVERRDYVIVGIDPGTTTAVAIVGINGEVLDVFSSRTHDPASVIEWIVSRGRPFLVAADVTPMPNTVEKIRRSFDAAGWIPSTDLLVDRKLHRTRDVAYENDHERDALAAALFAHDDHRAQFERITDRVPPRLDRDEVIARVIADEESVKAVIDDLQPSVDAEDDASAEPKPQTPSPEQQRIRQLEDRVDRLEAHASTQEETIDERDERIAELEAELSQQRRNERESVRERRAVTRLKREVSRLERERDDWQDTANQLETKLERLKKLWRLDHANFSDLDPEKRGLVPVKPIEKFTIPAIERAQSAFGLTKGDVILLRDATGASERTARELASIKPRAVIKQGGLTDVAKAVLFEQEIPVGELESVRVEEIDDLAVARESDVDDLVAAWEDRARQRERDQRTALVDQLISEHRADRLSDT